MICLFLTTSFLFLNLKSDYGLMSDEELLFDEDDNNGIGTDDGPTLMELYTGTVPDPVEKNVAMIDTDGSGFFLTEAAFWVNFLAIICNLVTLVNMLFEAQIVVQMCLEFIDEDDESYKYTDQAATISQPVV